MRSLDVRRVFVKKASRPNGSLLSRGKIQRNLTAAHKGGYRRMWVTAVFFLAASLVMADALWQAEVSYWKWSYGFQSEVQKLRVAALSRYNPLPIEEIDPKVPVLAQYLNEKKSPLANYAGQLARLRNWKLLLGIAHAETNLCKKTDKNNCWGIGPGKPFRYEDIVNSLYYANYLLDKYQLLGMDNPETMVRTYVGYYNPNWIAAINDIYYELRERGL